MLERSNKKAGASQPVGVCAAVLASRSACVVLNHDHHRPRPGHPARKQATSSALLFLLLPSEANKKVSRESQSQSESQEELLPALKKELVP